MARQAGFEPATYGLEVRCSIRAEPLAHFYFHDAIIIKFTYSLAFLYDLM